MEKAPNINTVVGQTRLVLVFGTGDQARPVITDVIVRPVMDKGAPRLRYQDPKQFNKTAQDHIETVVVPLFESYCRQLGIPPGHFEVSVVNVGAASSRDIGIEISGYSADLALLPALLSARLGIALPQNFVCTGHIASTSGDVRIVQNVPLKLQAAMAVKGIERFIFPSLETDPSVAGLAPAECQRIRAALAAAGDTLELVPVGDVSEMLRAVVTEEVIISAALRHRYFERRFPRISTGGAALGRTARVLGGNLKVRFFTVLQSLLNAGDAAAANDLLKDWVDYYIRRQHYPTGSGVKLRRVLLAVPPLVRRTRLKSPLVSVGACIRLSQFATSRDYGDVLDLYRIAASDYADEAHWLTSVRCGKPAVGHPSESSTLAIVAAEISREHLAECIGLPIDGARASYTLESPIARSDAESRETVTSFCIHLAQYAGRVPGRVIFDNFGHDAQALLERTFAQYGGAAAACAEARTGVRGGLRFVLDRMTDQYKHECQEKHVAYVLSNAVDELDWSAKVRFVKEFFQRFPDSLPAECPPDSIERFAKNFQLIVQTHINGIDQLRQLLRSM